MLEIFDKYMQHKGIEYNTEHYAHEKFVYEFTCKETNAEWKLFYSVYRAGMRHGIRQSIEVLQEAMP